MTGRRLSSNTGAVRGLAAAALLSFAAAGATQAQRTGGAGMGPPPDGPSVRREALERQDREAKLRSAEMLRPSGANNRLGVEAAVEQIKQDFTRIQILRNGIVRHISTDGPLDYKFVADEAAEINKRANRLKAYLVPQAVEAAAADEKEQKKQQPQVEFDGGQMRGALVTLCKRIESFVENPLFKFTGVVDVEQSAKAGGDLRSIIQLSADLKRSAERLSKTVKK